MTDSSFYAPGSGGGASNLNDLNDVIINTPVENNNLSYVNGNWVNSNPDAIDIKTTAPYGWYYPKGFAQNQNDFWDINYVTAAPISFTKDTYITDFGVFLKDWPGSGDFANNGGKIHGAIYTSNELGIPTTLVSNIGVINVSNEGPGGWGVTPLYITLDPGVVLSANTTYWVTIRKAINDGEGGYLSGQGPNMRQLIATGANEVLNNLPVGDNSLGWSGGQKGGLYLDDFYTYDMGEAPTTLGGMYPFVSWETAKIVLIDSSFNFALRGVVD